MKRYDAVRGHRSDRHEPARAVRRCGSCGRPGLTALARSRAQALRRRADELPRDLDSKILLEKLRRQRELHEKCVARTSRSTTANPLTKGRTGRTQKGETDAFPTALCACFDRRSCSAAPTANATLDTSAASCCAAS